MNPDPISPTLRAASEGAEATLVSATAGPGRVIRQARERAKLAIEELATLTRLAKSTLEALERDDFSTLTEAVYVRGYYRKCAKVLNLPEAELIAAYDKLYAPKTSPMPTKLLLGTSGSTMGSSRSNSSGGGWSLTLVVLAVLIGAAVWFLNQDAPERAQSQAAATPAVVETPSAAPSIPASELIAPSTTTPAADPAAPVATPAEAAAADAALLDAASGTPPAPPIGLALAPATTLSTPPTGIAPAPPAATEPDALVLDFKSASWVRIEDADGRTLLSGTIPSGDRQVLRGRTPYSLFIGYAPGVAVEFDGKPFDLTPHVRQNSTARLNLPYVPAPQ